MKAILEFNRDEEELDFQASAAGPRLASAVWEFLYNGHRDYKHHDPNGYYDGIKKAQDILRKLLEEDGINIDSLTR